MSDKRKIRFEGVEEGPFNLQKIMRMRERGELGNAAEFWSLRDKAWKPIVAMMTDFEVYDDDRMRSMREAGIKRVRVLPSGSDDCAVCAALADKIFAINEAPTFPPEGCTCVPWCRSILLAQSPE